MLERIGLAVKSGASGGVSGTVGSFQTASDWLTEKYWNLIGKPEYYEKLKEYNERIKDPEEYKRIKEEQQAELREKYPNAYVGTGILGRSTLVDPVELKKQSEQTYARAVEGTSGIGRFALEGLSSIANMGAGALTSLATGIPFVAVMGLQSGGSSALEARERGYDLDTQMLYGSATGLTSALIESLGGIGQSKIAQNTVGKIVPTMLSKLPASFTNWATKAGKSVFGRILKSFIDEAVEEGIEYNTDRFWNNLILDEDVPFDIKEMARSMLLGGTIGGLFGTAQVGIDAIRGGAQTSTPTDTSQVLQTTPQQEIASEPPTLTQDESLGQADIPIPQETKIAQSATESVTDGVRETAQNVQSVRSELPESVGAMKSKFPHEQKVSEFYTNTLQESDTISDEARAQLDEKDFGFVSVSEDESVEVAQQRLQVDFDGEVEHLSQADTYVAAEDVDTAMGILASYSAEASETGDWSKVKDWAQNMYEKVHQSAVTLQALDKYSRTPEGAVLKAQQEVSKAERSLTTTEVNGKRVPNKKGRAIADDIETSKTIIDDIVEGKDVTEKSKRLKKVKLQDLVDLVASGKYADDAIADLVKSQYGIPTLSADDVRNIYEYAKLAQETTDDYQKRVYEYKAAEIISNKMPVTFRDKVLMVRRLAMLLNPKTVISRNAGGNLIFGAAEIIKDAPGTVIDYLVSLKTGKRSTSLNLYETAKAQAKGAKKAVTEIAKDVKLGVDTSPTRHELPRGHVFSSKLGRGAEDLLNVLMQFGDRPFFEAAYEARMNELQRLGYDTNSEDVQSHVFNYALERVFQNDSELSKRASSIRKSLGLLGDIKIPFVQTPTNIFDKLLDYSPYGYARAIKQAGTISDSVWSQKQFVDTLARAFTGTGVLLFGYFGFVKGFLTGSKRDDNEKVVGAEQRAGSQEYSVVVGDKSYTYDWASPIGALLAMGANMAQAGVNQEGIVEMLTATTKAGIDIMFQQSYLQGLSELFGKENFSEGLQGVLMGLPASFIPTGFQQIARIIDDTQRDTFDKDPVMRMLKRMAVKIPFVSKMLPPKIDPTGEEAKQFQGRSTASNAFESFISPGYIGENVQNAVDKELYDLYSRTGDTDVLPRWSAYTSKADLKFSVGGQEYEMTDKEWIQYQKTLGKETYSNVDKLIKSPDYRKASDADKSEMIKDIISEATEKAKREIVEARGDMFLNQAGRERVQEYIKSGLNDKQAYELYKKIQALEPKDGKKTVSQEQKLDVILSSNHSAKTKAGLVATLYDNSLLHKLDSHSILLNIYKSTKDTSYINMTVPDKFSENKTEYVLTDSEKALYEKTFVEFMNKHGKPAPIGSMQAEQARMKKLIGLAKDRARLEVVKSRRK